MFPIKPTSFWNRRRVETPADPGRAGKLPSLSALLRGSAAGRVAWGRELGRRFRDEVREAEACGLRIDAWQFDELVAELSGNQGRAWRQFTRGVLHGLNFGRTELGDGPRIGFVWASRNALHIASFGSTPSFAPSGARSRARPFIWSARSTRRSSAIPRTSPARTPPSSSSSPAAARSGRS
jgi:hypothetical protein